MGDQQQQQQQQQPYLIRQADSQTLTTKTFDPQQYSNKTADQHHVAKIEPLVQSSTMVNEVQQFGIDTVILSVVKIDNNDYRKLAEYIKHEFDKRYGGYWGCIVGHRSQFDAFFHVQPYSYMSLLVGDSKFLIFKAATK